MSAGVITYAVGIAWAAQDELEVIATHPARDHSFFVDEFDNLYKFVPRIVKNICTEFNSQPRNWDRVRQLAILLNLGTICQHCPSCWGIRSGQSLGRAGRNACIVTILCHWWFKCFKTCLLISWPSSSRLGSNAALFGVCWRVHNLTAVYIQKTAVMTGLNWAFLRCLFLFLIRLCNLPYVSSFLSWDGRSGLNKCLKNYMDIFWSCDEKFLGVGGILCYSFSWKKEKEKRKVSTSVEYALKQRGRSLTELCLLYQGLVYWLVKYTYNSCKGCSVMNRGAHVCCGITVHCKDLSLALI